MKIPLARIDLSGDESQHAFRRLFVDAHDPAWIAKVCELNSKSEPVGGASALTDQRQVFRRESVMPHDRRRLCRRIEQRRARLWERISCFFMGASFVAQTAVCATTRRSATRCRQINGLRFAQFCCQINSVWQQKKRQSCCSATPAFPNPMIKTPRRKSRAQKAGCKRSLKKPRPAEGGSARTALPARSDARRRCARRLEARSPVSLAQRPARHPRTHRRHGLQVPLAYRVDRHLGPAGA